MDFFGTREASAQVFLSTLGDGITAIWCGRALSLYLAHAESSRVRQVSFPARNIDPSNLGSLMAALIEALPDAVALLCLARVPLSQHPNLRLVCKAWYSVVQSPELFQVRKSVGAVEDWLYVCSYERDKIWQAYDPLYNKWTILPPLPSAVQNLAYFGSIGIDGKLFVLGGGGDYVNPATGDREGPEVTQEVWAYDPVFRRWKSMAPMLMARRNFACFVYEGRIVVAGGFTKNSKSSLTVEVYDLEVNEWQPLADLKEVSVPMCSGVVLDGKMRVIQRAERVSQVYDSALNRWVEKTVAYKMFSVIICVVIFLVST